jgi:hypothetical protein
MLVTSTDPMAGRWTHYPHLLRPEQVFKWAAPGRAYAAQIVQGPSGKFYLYAPVVYAAATTRDKFAIGVAVADSPLSPWIDAHAQTVIAVYPIMNDIQNIDPTIFVDDDARVFLYWGTFGRLKGVELEPDMVTFKTTPIDVRTLNGFFEASWLFKRNGTYYMAYAANTAGPTSDCTEAVYLHQRTEPRRRRLGRGRMLMLFLTRVVDDVASESSITKASGTLSITRLTRNGGHSTLGRDRSARMDDAVTPPRTKSCRRARQPTPRRSRTSRRTRTISASNVPVPAVLVCAVNDGRCVRRRFQQCGQHGRATIRRSDGSCTSGIDGSTHGTSLHFWGDHAAGRASASRRRGVAPRVLG